MKNINEIKQGDPIWFNAVGLYHYYQDFPERVKLAGEHENCIFIKSETIDNNLYLCFDIDVNSESPYRFLVSDLIEKGYLELEKPIPLKEGMWVWARSGHHDYLVKLKKIINKNNIIVVGWISNLFGTYNTMEDSFEQITKIPTEQEIIQALLRAANQREFKEGVRFRSLVNDLTYKYHIDSITYNMGLDQLKSGGTFYMNGVWAELVKEEKEELNF